MNFKEYKKLLSNKINYKGGYAILFAVVIVSILSLIAIGLSNSTYKQLILSSVASDSQIAFYQSDTATECALYFDNVYLPNKGFNSIFNVSSWNCGKDLTGAPVNFTVQGDNSDDGGYYSSVSNLENKVIPCFDFDVTKSKNTMVDVTIHSKGYNNCNKSNFRTVEREIETTYSY